MPDVFHWLPKPTTGTTGMTGSAGTTGELPNNRIVQKQRGVHFLPFFTDPRDRSAIATATLGYGTGVRVNGSIHVD
jgi:hypothetical protein